MRLLLFATAAVCTFLVGGCASTSAPAADATLVHAFEEAVPGTTVISARSGDIDADGTQDLAVVYRTAEGTFRTRALLSHEGSATVTNEFKAPVEAQAVQLRDIDDKQPVEVIVRGSKNGAVGYAVYRVEGDQLVDVFDSGMANCCGR
ncbi:MAG: Cys-Cys-COOH (seleno)protein SaoC [Actinomycetota bacterium]|nr:MAG: hypothetical protein FD171_2005 [Actinomycetota bacterium]MDO8949999.1 Cys-Cys-COOH (seleno)protein SaoC [Actinomycetota bacterium]MDP3630208.1 Cys-Cys-COOH (seleno)protein SaoC [Actinomycetota bacterium]